jgi:hypothetical protein
MHLDQSWPTVNFWHVYIACLHRPVRTYTTCNDDLEANWMYTWRLAPTDIYTHHMIDPYLLCQVVKLAYSDTNESCIYDTILVIYFLRLFISVAREACL